MIPVVGFWMRFATLVAGCGLVTSVTGCVVSTAKARSMQDAIDRSFPSSFETSCRKTVLEQMLREHSSAAGAGVEQLPVALQERIKINAEPILEACACMRGRFNPQVESASNTETKVTLDIASPMLAECTPSGETVSKVRQGLMRMLHTMPAPVTTMKTKRAAFSIQAPAQLQASLYASYHRPPPVLTRLVHLVQGTGSACDSRMLCLDKAALEISTAASFRAKYRWASRSLDPVIAQFGEDAQIITSAHNYTNFEGAHMAGQAVYPVAFIDSLPVERTEAKQIWLVVFHDLEDHSNQSDVIPALATVIEVEFDDAR